MKTTDLCDNFSDKIKVATPSLLKNFGGKKSFSGKIQTVKCFENNPFVKKALEQNGKDKVLVVDGGGSFNCALLGDMLCEIAINNKWEGIIVNGCIRDTDEISKLPVGVMAIGIIPLRSGKKDEGENNVEISFAGLTFAPAEYVYCDNDGIIVSKEYLKT